MLLPLCHRLIVWLVIGGAYRFSGFQRGDDWIDDVAEEEDVDKPALQEMKIGDRFSTLQRIYMDVSKNEGIPKWMVKIMENPMKIHDLGGPPLFLETPIYR